MRFGLLYEARCDGRIRVFQSTLVPWNGRSIFSASTHCSSVSL